MFWKLSFDKHFLMIVKYPSRLINFFFKLAWCWVLFGLYKFYVLPVLNIVAICIVLLSWRITNLLKVSKCILLSVYVVQGYLVQAVLIDLSNLDFEKNKLNLIWCYGITVSYNVIYGFCNFEVFKILLFHRMFPLYKKTVYRLSLKI